MKAFRSYVVIAGAFLLAAVILSLVDKPYQAKVLVGMTFLATAAMMVKICRGSA